MERTTAILVVALLGLAAGPAAAEDTVGCLGFDDSIALSLSFGPAGVDMTGEGKYLEAPEVMEPYKTDGFATLISFRYGQFLAATRYGTLMGFEVGMTFGMLTQSAIARNADDLEPMTFGRFYYDMDGGLNLALVKWGGKGSGAGRIGVAGGAGFNSEIGYFYGGPRLAMQIIGDTLGIEGRFDFLPLAHSYSANTVREWRGSGTVVYQTSDDFGLGFGVELRNGSNPILDQAEFQAQLDDDADRIRKQDALRGDYQMTLATISCRWK